MPLIFVDDDAPNDPGPNDPGISDPLEDGSALNPFDSIQEAINSISDSLPYVIRIRDGNYGVPSSAGLQIFTQFQQVRFAMLEGENGPENCIIDAGGADHVVSFVNPQFDLRQGIRGVTITGATDSGVYCRDTTVSIDNCIIEGNTGADGGGIGMMDASPVISNCDVRGNVSSRRGGGIYALRGVPIVANCTVVENTGTTGGGIAFGSPVVFSGPPVTMIRNSTIANNTGGGIHFKTASGSSGVITASDLVVWGNTSGDQIQINTGTLQLPYANIQGGLSGILVLANATLETGPGFINLDPLFVDPAMGDYHLSAGSPCIDAGNPNFVPLPGETDIDGEARVQGAAVDLGSDERP